MLITMCIMHAPPTRPSAPVLLTLRVSPTLKDVIKTAAADSRLTINEAGNMIIEAGLETIIAQYGASLARFIAERQRVEASRLALTDAAQPVEQSTKEAP